LGYSEYFMTMSWIFWAKTRFYFEWYRCVRIERLWISIEMKIWNQ